MKKIGLLFLLLFLVSAGTIVTRPDLERTPGGMCTPSDLDFREYRYAEKIPYCTRNVSGSTKAGVYASYGVHGDTSKYTIDHLIPLSMGGSNSVQNLWPQHVSVNTSRVEQLVYLKLSSGEITQREAIDTILKIKIEGNPNASRTKK